MSSSTLFSSTQGPEGIQDGGANLHWLDYVVILLYFIGILIVGFWSSRKSKDDSVSGYFLANRSMHWLLVGTSLFATNIGSMHFIGLAGSGASSGIAISAYEIHGMFIYLLLGWLFVPVYNASGVNTMPEYMRRRFGGQRIRIYLSVLALILYVFTKISADLYAGAIFIKQALNLNMYISVIILLSIAGLFTIAGGLTAVMWTDFVQTILMVAGALVLCILSLIKVGGYRNLMDNFEANALPNNKDYMAFKDSCTLHSINTTCVSCSAVTEYYYNLFRPATDPELPWSGMAFGLTVIAVWFCCSDQVIVQRALSAKNVSHAKAGCILSSALKLLPLYLMVLPGMAARVLWPNEIGCSNPEKCKSICGSESGCTNIAYPLLVLRIMPLGATGLMLSVMMAALMSSLTSIFNSASTIFTIDIYTRFRKNSGEIEQVIVGRLFVFILVIISIIWIPIIEASQGSQLFHYVQSVTSYLAPPVCAVYVLGVFWGRINEKGAFWGLMIGLVIGIIRFAMEFSYTVPLCGSGVPDLRPLVLSKVHYLHFGIILFIISCIVTTAISLWTEPIDDIHLHRLTFWTKFSEKVRIDIDSEPQVKDDGIYNNGFTPDITHDLKTINNNESKKYKNCTALDQNENKMKWLYTICCMSSQNKANNNYDINIEPKDEIKLSKEEEAIKAANDAKEKPFWQSVTNIGAILVIAIASFFYGLYA